MAIQEIKSSVNLLKNKGFFALVSGIFGYVSQRMLIPYYVDKIKSFRSVNEKELIDFAFNSRAGILKPAQIKSEIYSLMKILAERKPKKILEIGTAKGGTLFLMTKVLPRDAEIISLDMRGGSFGGGYAKWRTPLYRSFASENQELNLVLGDSHSEETLNRIKKILRYEKVDFLFIDGDHSYEGIKKDFEMYSPLVKKGGLIAFHDIVEHFDKTCRVSDFWEELKKKYKHTEIIESKQQGICGIGLIFK